MPTSGCQSARHRGSRQGGAVKTDASTVELTAGVENQRQLQDMVDAVGVGRKGVKDYVRIGTPLLCRFETV